MKQVVLVLSEEYAHELHEALVHAKYGDEEAIDKIADEIAEQLAAQEEDKPKKKSKRKKK
jgi:hypothetical protein